MQKLGQAFKALHYDMFVLSSLESAALRSAGFTLPEHWHEQPTEPTLVTVPTAEGQLAIFLFPDQPDAQAKAKIMAMAQGIRKAAQHNLLIGISPWGVTLEQEFLDSCGDTLDILFGSGEGPSYSGLYVNNDAVVWARAPLKGKGVNVLTIPDLPQPGTKVFWQPEVNIRGEILPLADNIAQDSEMINILAQ